MSRTPVANALRPITVQISAPGTAEQVMELEVPDGFRVLCRARAANDGNYYLGRTKAETQATATRAVLEPGEFLTLQVDSTDAIWFDADYATDYMEVIVEQP